MLALVIFLFTLKKYFFRGKTFESRLTYEFEYFYFWDLFRNKIFLLAQLDDVDDVDDVDIVDDVDDVDDVDVVDDVGDIDNIDGVDDVDDVDIVVVKQLLYVGDVNSDEVQIGKL